MKTNNKLFLGLVMAGLLNLTPAYSNERPSTENQDEAVIGIIVRDTNLEEFEAKQKEAMALAEKKAAEELKKKEAQKLQRKQKAKNLAQKKKADAANREIANESTSKNAVITLDEVIIIGDLNSDNDQKPVEDQKEQAAPVVANVEPVKVEEVKIEEAKTEVAQTEATTETKVEEKKPEEVAEQKAEENAEEKIEEKKEEAVVAQTEKKEEKSEDKKEEKEEKIVKVNMDRDEDSVNCKDKVEKAQDPALGEIFQLVQMQTQQAFAMLSLMKDFMQLQMNMMNMMPMAHLYQGNSTNTMLQGMMFGMQMMSLNDVFATRNLSLLGQLSSPVIYNVQSAPNYQLGAELYQNPGVNFDALNNDQRIRWMLNNERESAIRAERKTAADSEDNSDSESKSDERATKLNDSVAK